MKSVKARHIVLAVVAAIILLAAYTSYKIVRGILSFEIVKQSSFTYGPYSCGNETLTVRTDIRENRIEGHVAMSYAMTFGDDTYSTWPTGAREVIPIRVPDQWKDFTDQFGVSSQAEVPFARMQAFANCLSTHQTALYESIRKDYPAHIIEFPVIDGVWSVATP